MQALANGETIQERVSGYWVNLTNPAFDAPADCYRIKPKPLELWVNVHAHVGYAYESKETAEAAEVNALHVAVHMKEVE